MLREGQGVFRPALTSLYRQDLLRTQAALCADVPVWSKNSCGFTLVVFEEAPKSFATLNRALTLWGLADSRKEQHVAFSLMISLVMINLLYL